MDFTGKKVLVIGMARSGFAAAKALLDMGAAVTVTDKRPQADFQDKLDAISGCELYFGQDPDDIIPGKDLIVISPGVPIDSPFLDKARVMGIKIIGEIELA
ncbi:MAG TPA: NAD(P)-dependent oxidoreductase, partial [Clostridia bacterium]|nr:NAD(P)-dependent oxidoreductase [Clostridia bacterium]